MILSAVSLIRSYTISEKDLDRMIKKKIALNQVRIKTDDSLSVLKCTGYEAAPIILAISMNL